MLTFPSHVCAGFGGLGGERITRTFLRASGMRALGRSWLRRTVLSHELARPADITVLIGVRNRSDYRLANALKSLRAQTYPARLTRIVVIDYGSEPTSARSIAEVCREGGAEYIRVDDAPVWSRSRGLNVGILGADVDLVLSRRYSSDAVDALKESPLSVIAAPMLDLPEETAGICSRSSDAQEELPLEPVRSRIFTRRSVGSWVFRIPMWTESPCVIWRASTLAASGESRGC